MPAFLINHCCLGDICVSSNQSPVTAGKHDTAVKSARVYNVVYLTHKLTMASDNNKTFVQKTKSLKDSTGREQERPMHIATALKGSIRGENSWMISSLSPGTVLLGMVQ